MRGVFISEYRFDPAILFLHESLVQSTFNIISASIKTLIISYDQLLYSILTKICRLPRYLLHHRCFDFVIVVNCFVHFKTKGVVCSVEKSFCFMKMLVHTRLIELRI